MFSFRRKNKRDQDDDGQIHTSPSLPELTAQGLSWPENLVDVASIQQLPAAQPILPGAAKTSISTVSSAAIPFHKPSREFSGKALNGVPISSYYMSGQVSALDNWRSSNHPSATRKSQRRSRIPPTFNLMVVGAQGTGKTSLLRLLLETADIAPTATVDQRAAVDRFLHGPTKRTPSIQTACVEICESRFDRVLLSVIDTPGLDFLESRELKLERQVGDIIKYLDTQYADTMSEESKVIRQNKGDQHIHLIIYMIDPSSVITPSGARGHTALPTKTRSEATISYRPPELVPDNASDDDSDEDTASQPLQMSPVEIRVIRRLSARSNVLPVIARADSLTDEMLAAVKDAVRTGLRDAGLGFGVFDAVAKAGSPKDIAMKRDAAKKTAIAFADEIAEDNEESNENEQKGQAEEEESEDERNTASEDRQSRPVIKLRPSRHRGPRLSRSRSRRDMAESGSPDAADRESVANVRFSAHLIAKTDLSSLLPFALIAPGDVGRLRNRPESSMTSPSVQDPSEEGGRESLNHATSQTVHSPNSHSARNFAYLSGPPDDLKGMFTRKFRWGTVDVLDPNHCDFAALRTAVLSTHLQILKTHTKEVLYEKYRTEKLLARRATRNISDQERQKLLKDLGL